MEQIRRNLLGRVGIVATPDIYPSAAPVQPTSHKPGHQDIQSGGRPLRPLVSSGRCLVPLYDGEAFVALEDTECCYDGCRAFPSQVKQLCAVHKDHRLLLCSECMFQGQYRMDLGCTAHSMTNNCLDGISNLFADETMQNMLMNEHVHHVRKSRQQSEWKSLRGTEKLPTLIRAVEAIAPSVVAGLGDQFLASCARLSRRLDR